MKKVSPVTDRQQQVLDALENMGPPGGMTVVEVAETCLISRDAANGALRRLLDKHAVRKSVSIDGKFVLFRLWDSEEEEPTPEFDRGWLEGYEAGKQSAIVAAKAEDVGDAYQSGLAAGKKVGRREMGNDVLLLTARMQAQLAGRVAVHTSTCWMQHPYCALDGVRKLIVRTSDAGALPQEVVEKGMEKV